MTDMPAGTGKKLMVFKKKTPSQEVEFPSSGPPWKILVIDDDRQVHLLTEEILRDFIFEGRSLKLASGYSGRDAQALLKNHPDAALVLLDVVMETSHAGLEVVRFIREELGNQKLRILLRTGQAGQFPEDKIFEEYDINNFLEKTDLTSRRLKTAIKVALRSYRDMCELDEARQRETELRRSAEAASQAKSNFLHMMSHELRTPLQGTKGPFEEFKSQFHLFTGMKKLKSLIDALDDPGRKSAFLAAMTEVREEVADIAGQGLKSVEHLLALIEDVLDFARIEAGKLSLHLDPQIVAPCIEECLLMVRPLAEKKGLSLQTRLDENLVVRADGRRLKQILLNLLGNAIKFTGQGAVSLDAARDGALVRFCIKDTGCGIPAEKLGLIFEAFEQVDNSSTRQAGGTGLGLPITAKLVKMQGGAIQVESIPGQGSRFCFTLPLA
ncbi:MAG: hypothetical protein HQL56_12945 [Magnetococcales bacterium]|nr:hypothetical protein [Magnetococcales bacterium]